VAEPAWLTKIRSCAGPPVGGPASTSIPAPSPARRAAASPPASSAASTPTRHNDLEANLAFARPHRHARSPHVPCFTEAIETRAARSRTDLYGAVIAVTPLCIPHLPA